MTEMGEMKKRRGRRGAREEGCKLGMGGKMTVAQGFQNSECVEGRSAPTGKRTIEKQALRGKSKKTQKEEKIR